MKNIREINEKRSIESYKYISDGDEELFEDLVQRDPRIEVFWQNSSIAGEVIKWYPFDPFEEIVIFEDVYSNYSNVLKRKKLIVLEGSKEEIKTYGYKYAIFNLRAYPNQCQINIPLFVYKLENI